MASKRITQRIHSILGTQAHFARSQKHRRDIWLLLEVVFLSMVIILTLSRAESWLQAATKQVPLQTASSSASKPAGTRPEPSVQSITPRLYPMGTTAVGLMQPSVDAQGNLWVGEMSANRLARLNTHTGAVTTWEPPHAQSGIMTTTVDSHGEVWFVEQAANYIGRFDPVQQTFRTFPLGTVQGRPMGPQSLQFDASGMLWFTAVAGGSIGRLDPVTGAVQTWPIPVSNAATPPAPFSLSVAADGRIWFGLLSGGAVGFLDPSTGQITLLHLPDPQAAVFALTHDAQGRIWFTELQSGKLGFLDPATNRIIERTVPIPQGIPAALYAIVSTPNGDIWFANNTANALVRYRLSAAAFTIFQLSEPESPPYGLTLDRAGTLWFTSTGLSVGKMIPKPAV
jgi:virginiamycin B lyase